MDRVTQQMRQHVVSYDAPPVNTFEWTVVVNIVLIPRLVYRAFVQADSTAPLVWDHALRNFVTKAPGVENQK